jgi:hypothetical protein
MKNVSEFLIVDNRKKAMAISKDQNLKQSSIRLKMATKGGMRLNLKPVNREYIHSLRGKFKGKQLLKALMAERKEW